MTGLSLLAMIISLSRLQFPSFKHFLSLSTEISWDRGWRIPFYCNSSGIYSTPHDLFSPLWLPKFRHFHALLKIPTKVHTLKVREPEGTRDLTLCIFFFETLSLARALRLFTLSFSELMEYSCLWQPGLFRNFFERNSSLSLHIKQRRCPVMKYKAFLVFLWHAVDSRCSCLCGGC